MAGQEGSVRFGLKRAFWAKKLGEGKYAKPVAFKYPKSVDMSDKSGSKSIIYGGDRAVYTNGGGGSRELGVTMTHFDREFLKEILGQTVDAEGGGLVESASDVMSAFAFGIETNSDQGAYRTWFLDCTSSNVSFSPKTNEESISEVSETATFTAVEATMKGGKSMTMYTLEPGDSGYDAAFDAVPFSDGKTAQP
ncbi:major tail protein [Collinsella vaginalis]|nr:major tail protein [Collinsella vaginalis]